jgi:hypothetical protein
MSSNNAQNTIAFSQSDNANAAHLKGSIYGFGSVDAPGFNPTTGFMWTGTGQPNTGYNTSTNDGVQLGFNVIHRTDGFYTPDSYSPNHEANYTVLSGTQTINGGNPNRAEWNVGYEGATSNTVNLNAYDFKMQIVESRPGFIASDVFDLNTATHVWTGEASGLAFGGDDFAPGGAPASTMAAVFENSLNVAFLKGDLFGTLPQETSSGTHWDFKQVAFSAGSPHEIAANAIHIAIQP